jgi:hypothetical protein
MDAAIQQAYTGPYFPNTFFAIFFFYFSNVHLLQMKLNYFISSVF